MRKRLYRIAVLRILASMVGSGNQFSYKGKACQTPRDYLFCAMTFADEYVKQMKHDGRKETNSVNGGGVAE